MIAGVYGMDFDLDSPATPVSSKTRARSASSISASRKWLNDEVEVPHAAGVLFGKRGAKLYLDQVIAKQSVLGA